MEFRRGQHNWKILKIHSRSQLIVPPHISVFTPIASLMQTIASLKHESALNQINQAIARRADPHYGPSLGVPAPIPKSTIALHLPPTGRSKRRPSSMSVVNRVSHINSTPKYKSTGYSEGISSRVSRYGAPPRVPSTPEQPETPRGRRSYSLASAPSPQASSPTHSVESSHRGGRTLSIDDVVDDAIKRGSWIKTPPHGGHRAARDVNSSSRRDRHIQFRSSTRAVEEETPAAEGEPPSAEDRSGKATRDLKHYSGALGAPSGRPLLRVREATQSGWDESDGIGEERDRSVAAALQRARRPITSMFSPVALSPEVGGEVGGESETKETHQKQQKWMGLSLGNGESRRSPTSQMSPRRQQETKKPSNLLSWSGIRKERHTAVSGFGSEGNGTPRDGFGVHEDRRGSVSSTRHGREARNQPPPENGDRQRDGSTWGEREHRV